MFQCPLSLTGLHHSIKERLCPTGKAPHRVANTLFVLPSSAPPGASTFSGQTGWDGGNSHPRPHLNHQSGILQRESKIKCHESMHEQMFNIIINAERLTASSCFCLIAHLQQM